MCTTMQLLLVANTAAATITGSGAGPTDVVGNLLSKIVQEPPVSLRVCALSVLPAHTPVVCNVTGIWRYNWGGDHNYTIAEQRNGSFIVTSTNPHDPWIRGIGQVDLTPRKPRPAKQYCSGPGWIHPAQGTDVTIVYKESEKNPNRKDATRTGNFSPDCNVMHMSDGSVITRFRSTSTTKVVKAEPDHNATGAVNMAMGTDGCKAAKLRYRGMGKAGASALQPGWSQQNVTYGMPAPSAGAAGDDILLVRVTFDIDPTNSTIRLYATLSALADLPFCLGGVSILNVSVAHAQYWDQQPASILGLTGGYADRDQNNALQPWTCSLNDPRKANRSCDLSQSRVPQYQYYDGADPVVSVDSGPDGRSSNTWLPIWSVAVGSTAGVWMGPEYSGIWALNAYKVEGTGTQFLISLPSLLFTMLQGEDIELPRAALGHWSQTQTGGGGGPLGSGGDWSNAVRSAITTHFTPRFDGEPPVALAEFQGLSGIPRWETESVLHSAVDVAAALGLEAFTFDAGVYFPINASGDWWTYQGDYLPVRSRFPRDGFMALERNITQVHGLQYGFWITPQAQPGTHALDNNPELYLSPAGNDTSPTRCCRLSYLLNLALPGAQDLFFSQFETMIVRFNASRIWFDYNTAARSTHWNHHETATRQGLLELGFYRGLYAVFERTLRTYPHVWVEGCASGGRMLDLGSLSRTHSMWINDDSVADDRNRAKRGGANHFIPAHYLQNAFFVSPAAKSSGTPNQSLGHDDRLLTYFNGVLQLGEGMETLTAEGKAAVARYVKTYKGDFRQYLDPMKANYYRLFRQPFDMRSVSPGAPKVVPSATVSAPAGWVYEDPASGTGYLYVTRQVNCPSAQVVVPLTRAAAAGAQPKWGAGRGRDRTANRLTGDRISLEYVAGDTNVTWTSAPDHIMFTFPVADRAVLLHYGSAES